MSEGDQPMTEHEMIGTIGVTLMAIGVASGLTYLHRPHPLIPPASATLVLAGLGVLWWSILTDTSTDELPEDGLHPAMFLSMVTFLAGTLLYPTGVVLDLPFGVVAVIGTGLLMFAMAMAAVADRLTDGASGSTTTHTVPDDPTQILEEP